MTARQIISTFSDGRRQREERLTPSCEAGTREQYLLNIYPHMQYQTIMGFGGAITDAVAAALERMSDARAQEVIDAYFGPKGIGYNRIRAHIDSCDFSTEQYAAAGHTLPVHHGVPGQRDRRTGGEHTERAQCGPDLGQLPVHAGGRESISV